MGRLNGPPMWDGKGARRANFSVFKENRWRRRDLSGDHPGPGVQGRFAFIGYWVEQQGEGGARRTEERDGSRHTVGTARRGACLRVRQMSSIRG